MKVIQKYLKASPGNMNIAEHFCCDNTLTLLIKLETNSDFSNFLRSGSVLPQVKCSAFVLLSE